MENYIVDLVFLVTLLTRVHPRAAQLVWERLDMDNTTNFPSARRDTGLGFDAARNRLVLFGGRTKVSSSKLTLDDTWIYDIASKRWREVHAAVHPRARHSYVGGISGQCYYVATGRGAHGVYFSDIWCFRLKSEEWDELSAQRKPDYYTALQWSVAAGDSVQPSFRHGAAGGVFPNASRFYIYAGCSAQAHGDTYSYDIQDGSWYMEYADLGPYSPTTPHARYQHAGTMISPHELLVHGGCLSGAGSGGACPASDAWIYDARRRQWAQIDGCASARKHAAVAMLPLQHGERRVVLYGGEEEGPQVLTTVPAPPHQVAVFNPDSLQWTLKASEGDVPSKRSSVAMATGDVGIYMFGGIELSSDDLKSDLYLLRGDPHSADRAATHAQCGPTFFNLLTLHGILMTLGCGFFLQWGAFLARYCGHRWPLWYHLHRLFQVFGLTLAVAGFIVGVLSVRSSHFRLSHAIIGLVVMVLGLLQPINALLRFKLLGEDSTRTLHRAVWRFTHGLLGYSSLALSLVNISLGLLLAHAHTVIWIMWYVYVGVLIMIRMFAEIRLQKKKQRLQENEHLESSAGNKYRIHIGEEAREGKRSLTKSIFDNPGLVH